MLVVAILIIEMLQHYRTRSLTRTRHSAEHLGATPSMPAAELAEDPAGTSDRQADRAESTNEADPLAGRGRRRRVLAIAAGILRGAAVLATLLHALHQTGVL